MVLAWSEDHSINQLCIMAGGFLDELSNIPTTYMRSTSVAMVCGDNDHTLKRHWC